MRIRPAATADRTRLLDIWRAASQKAHAFLGTDTIAIQAETVRDVYLVQADNWVIEDAESVLGFIGLIGAHVGGLFVDPASHGRGAGRGLVEHAAARLGALSVEVYEANEAARAFYRRCGFAETGRKPLDDEGRPFPLVRMERPEGSVAQT